MKQKAFLIISKWLLMKQITQMFLADVSATLKNAFCHNYFLSWQYAST